MAATIATLHAAGKEIILVSSGAVALGRAHLDLTEDKRGLALEQKQAAAAIGQPLLMQAWQGVFAPHGVTVAQLLLTLDDSEQRRRYLNARDTFRELLAHRVIPIINENDTVATAELKFGDNDRLAARVAVMISADMLVLFSDIDGLYSADPRKVPAATFFDRIDALTPEIMAMGGSAASGFSNGGMKTKLEAAQMVLAAGCHMAIARGSDDGALQQLIDGGRASWFVASTKPQIARKHWIASTVHLPGAVVIDAGAERALRDGKSLLPAGVTAIEGKFERGDIIEIKNASGTPVAKGISEYSALEARQILGKKTGEIAAILGYKGCSTLIHRDDLAMV